MDRVVRVRMRKRPLTQVVPRTVRVGDRVSRPSRISEIARIHRMRRAKRLRTRRVALTPLVFAG